VVSGLDSFFVGKTEGLADFLVFVLSELIEVVGSAFEPTLPAGRKNDRPIISG
jgi:hypothetical protein